MSEQDDASVNRFLDGLDDRRDEVAAVHERLQARSDVPTWEYMVWDTIGTKAGRSIRSINGDALEAYSPEYPALVKAGEQGWQLTGVVGTGGRQAHVLYFRRPLVED
jgi:hypothetical protein